MNRFLKSFTAMMNRAGRNRTRELLLRQSDRTLADAGFSRELLLRGVQAWPWRGDEVLEDARDAELLRERQRLAIAELRAMNDRELADLSLARADIPRAVREGRVGIEIAESDERLAA